MSTPDSALSLNDMIRKRPGMFIGSVRLFGFINYLVEPVADLLKRRPTRLALTALDDGLLIEADVAIPIHETLNGRLSPFEENAFRPGGEDEDRYFGSIFNALSEHLVVEVSQPGQTETLIYHRGVRQSRQVTDGPTNGPKTLLRMAPDASIFTVTSLPASAIQSYLRRLSYLYPDVHFSFISSGETHQYHAPRGLLDLYDAITAPYQVLHDPIHIVGEDRSLRLEAVLAYHSWGEKRVACFVNNGRAVDGGTHEQGLSDALEHLATQYLPPPPHKTSAHPPNGVVGVLSIHYPGVVWQGCIKSRINSPELRQMVRDLIVDRAAGWLAGRPEVARQLRRLETFQFPDSWYA